MRAQVRDQQVADLDGEAVELLVAEVPQVAGRADLLELAHGSESSERPQRSRTATACSGTTSGLTGSSCVVVGAEEDRQRDPRRGGQVEVECPRGSTKTTGGPRGIDVGVGEAVRITKSRELVEAAAVLVKTSNARQLQTRRRAPGRSTSSSSR